MSDSLATVLFGPRAEGYAHPSPTDSFALVSPNQHLTFAELTQKVSEVVTVAENIPSGARVMIAVHDSFPAIIQWLGLLASGKTPAMVPYLVNEIELQEFLVACEPNIILCDSQIQVLLRTLHRGQSKVVRSLGRLVRDDHLTQRIQNHLTECAISDNIRSSIEFSAGTVTAPRASLHHYDNLAHLVSFYRDQLNLAPGDMIYVPGFNGGSMQEVVLAPLLAGIGVILSSAWPSASEIIRTLDTYDPHAIIAPVSLYRYMLRILEPEMLNMLAGPTQHFFAHGEMLDEQLIQRWYGVTGQPLIGLYSLSEANGFLLVGNSEMSSASHMFAPPYVSIRKVGSPYPDSSLPVTLEISAPSVALRYLSKTNWPRFFSGQNTLSSWDYFVGTPTSGVKFLSKSELTWQNGRQFYFAMSIEREIASLFPITQGAFLMPEDAPVSPEEKWTFAFSASPSAPSDLQANIGGYLQERLPFLRCKVVVLKSLPMSSFAKIRRRPQRSIGVATYPGSDAQ